VLVADLGIYNFCASYRLVALLHAVAVVAASIQLNCNYENGYFSAIRNDPLVYCHVKDLVVESPLAMVTSVAKNSSNNDDILLIMMSRQVVNFFPAGVNRIFVAFT